MNGSPARSIEHLDVTWQSIGALCAELTPDEWETPTGCPGWSVKDQVSHLVDYESRALGHVPPDHVPAVLDHVKNTMGEYNEVGVDARRPRPGPEVLAEFTEVTAARLAQLRALSEEALQGETMTPVGPGSVADMLTLRVMDTWSHEQDIRRALGRPGHESGPVVTESVEYWAQYLPYVVGKQAAAPEGSSVVLTVGEDLRRVLVVEGGRARFADDVPADPTVVISMSAPTFAARVGGRTDAPDDAVIEGDAALGHAVVDHLGFLP